MSAATTPKPTPTMSALAAPRPTQSTGAGAVFTAILTIASRDVRRFLRDRPRLIATLVFPLLFVGVLGGSLQNNLGHSIGFNLLTFTFIGVFAQTIFQSTVSGLVSLIEDRENDFSQELFIAPISRYAIVFGKILGESLVAFMQAIVVVIFGVVAFGIPIDLHLLALLPVGLLVCLLGGAFGVLLVSLFGSQRAANQIIPFIIFPQFFLAGVFTPIKNLPWYLDILARIAPLRYAVDITRDAYYAGRPEYNSVVLASPLVNLIVILIMFTVFLVLGSWLFIRSERNR